MRVFLSVSVHNWHGITATSNLTFSRALGNGGTTQNGITSMDTFNRDVDYRPLGHDIPWVYNAYALYELPYYRSQRGVAGTAARRMVGGAAVHARKAASPLCVGTGAESMGGWAGGCAVGLSRYTAGNTAHLNVETRRQRGTRRQPLRGGSGINMFTDPQAVYKQFRPMVLGIDGRFGNFLRGFPRWNFDMAVKKTILFREGIGATLSFEFLNFFNHFAPADPSLNYFAPTSFGVVTGQAIEPRRVNLGLRVFF